MKGIIVTFAVTAALVGFLEILLQSGVSPATVQILAGVYGIQPGLMGPVGIVGAIALFYLLRRVE